MSKKIWMAGVVALALLIGIVGVAAAAPQADPPNPPGPRGGPGRGENWPPSLVGEITAIGNDQFTLVGPQGGSYTIEVTEFTSYLGELESFADLEVGAEVGIAGQRSGEGTVVARVVAMRDELPFGTRIGGEVTAVGNTEITIETRGGQTFTFDVNADTDYLSRENTVQSLADIEVGDHVQILFEQASSGTLTANIIMIGGQPEAAPTN